MRSTLDNVGVLYCLGCNLLHHCDELIERLLALCLGRLNHDALVEQQRDGIANGHSEHYVEIDIPADADLNGKIVPVLLDGTDGKICTGHVMCGKKQL